MDANHQTCTGIKSSYAKQKAGHSERHLLAGSTGPEDVSVLLYPDTEASMVYGRTQEYQQQSAEAA
jgi:hypothetical protein